MRAHRLARLVRLHARREAARRRGGGVVDFRSIARRGALYELIARRLEKPLGPAPTRETLSELQGFFARPAPSLDAGMTARARDARVASILLALEENR
jgi:hypothetical protein